jgi:hypothetical protein
MVWVLAFARMTVLNEVVDARISVYFTNVIPARAGTHNPLAITPQQCSLAATNPPQ